MDALQHLGQHVDITRLLEHYKFPIRHEGNMVRSKCCIHGGDNPSSFVANTENNLWFCHTECGGGDVYTLVEKMEGISFKESVRFVAEFFKVDIADLKIQERKSSYFKELTKWMNIMKRKRKEENKPYVVQNVMKDVLKFRSFQTETLDHFGLKFIESIECERSDGGVYTLTNRLAIPIHNEYGVTVGVSLRATKSSDVPKWSHQPRNIRTSDMLYNYDQVKASSLIVVCEGIFDVWAFYEIGLHAVCTYGAHLSDEQYRLLLKCGADICLAYDGDEAGRVATSRAIKLLKNKTNLCQIVFNDGEDPENIERGALSERYSNRKRL